jgi:hypothetical protein
MLFTSSQCCAIIRGFSKDAPALLAQPGAGPTGSEDTVSNTDFTLDQTVAAGDPFLVAAAERPCLCWFGFVYIGCMVEHEDGETEVFERVPCRKCGEGS